MNLALSAPAKLNLGLEVLGKRPDGLHDLASIMVNVDLADEVSVVEGGGLEMTGTYGVQVEPGVELASRALRALEGEAGRPLGRGLSIAKYIPVGAGLGGGSADAAAVLRAASAIGVEIAPNRLAEIALQLGADVPFQLLGGAALVTGAGERLEQLELEETWLAVGFVGLQVSTVAVFAELRADEWGSGKAVETAARAIRAGVGAAAVARLPNDLLAPATRLYPALEDLIASLRKRGWDPRLTGSGSALFQVCWERPEAESLCVKAWDVGMRAWAVRTIPPPR
ncbi:MAG TPA: 4-(cytidine 5'-diphospho)-2-C-methyl-D-erythritol kinase [Candidatus Dormibacteraeota bacterium]|nr:4-(cytidine 5'-diphospho)-2-C-methyl-D-erythritol kinase [Candidatus Dormibacteraeota bacterium]